MWLGESEKDYYLGALTNPGTSAGAERSNAAAGIAKPEKGAGDLPTATPEIRTAKEGSR
jgi:NADH-quinone oxidoreductase subunit I